MPRSILLRDWLVLGALVLFAGLALGSAHASRLPQTPAPIYLPLVHQNTALRVPLILTEANGVARQNDPVTSGVPLPRASRVFSTQQLALVDAAGQPAPAQFTPLARWGGAPDDESQPIQWVLVDFQANVPAGGSAAYQLLIYPPEGPLPPPAQHPTPLIVQETAAAIEINSHAARFSINKNQFGLFDQVFVDSDGDGQTDDPLLAGPGQIAAAAGGDLFLASLSQPEEVVIEQNGPLRAVVRLRGHLTRADGKHLLAYTARLHFYAGRAEARLDFTVWNDNLMKNRGDGQPDIKAFGSPHTTLFASLNVQLTLAGAAAPAYQLGGAGGETWSGTLQNAASLYQDSSGGPQWNHPPDNAANTLRGFEAQADGVLLHPACSESAAEETCRSEGWASLQMSGQGVAAGVRDFWQNYPKAIELSANGLLSLALFPERYSQDFELRVGEQKTHTAVFSFSAAGSAAVRALLHPLQAWATADYYINQAQVFDRAIPRSSDPAFAGFEGYTDAAILDDGMNLFWLRNGAVDSNWLYSPRPEAWGWRNYGDSIAEDETPSNDYPVFTNQQYDHPWGAILQAVRAVDAGGGRTALWWEWARSGALHQADIDIIHSRCTGLPLDDMVACMDPEIPYPIGWAMGGRLTNQWHAWPVVDIHRNALIDYWSGGIRGMLYYYYLTGDGVVYDAWLEVAENARWRVTNPDAGYPELNPGDYDVRAAAYALEILTDAYAATGDPAYDDAAQIVIAASHPANTWFGQPGYYPDPNVAPAGKITAPWGMTILMRSLGRYLDLSVQMAGAPDAAARASLLEYASLLASWWRPGEDEPACYGIGENGGCNPDAGTLGLADGLAYALLYADGDPLAAGWPAIAAEAWERSENDPWNGYAQNTFLTTKNHFMLANSGVAWMSYWLGRQPANP